MTFDERYTLGQRANAALQRWPEAHGAARCDNAAGAFENRSGRGAKARVNDHELYGVSPGYLDGNDSEVDDDAVAPGSPEAAPSRASATGQSRATSNLQKRAVQRDSPGTGELPR